MSRSLIYNRTFIVAEVIIIITSFCFAIKWITNPDGQYEPYLTLISLISSGALDFLRRHKGIIWKETFALNIDYRQLILPRFISKEKHKGHGKLGLILYSFDVINTTDRSFTIKEFFLIYEFREFEYKESPVKLPTGKRCKNGLNDDETIIYNNVGSENQPALNTIVLMKWQNVGDELGKRPLIAPMGVFRASAFFILNRINSLDEILSMKNIRIRVIDFEGRLSEFPIDISDQIIKQSRTAVILYEWQK